MPSLGKAYLLAYNVAQCAGLSYMLGRSAPFLWPALVEGADAAPLYRAVWPALSLFQTAAALEILHAALGLVKSSVLITFCQVFSRVAITWAVVHQFPEAQSCRGLPMLLLAWQVTEVVRYSFYAFGLVGPVPGAVTWMRYTLFLVLYPLGVTGELWAVVACLDKIQR